MVNGEVRERVRWVSGVLGMVEELEVATGGLVGVFISMDGLGCECCGCGWGEM